MKTQLPVVVLGGGLAGVQAARLLAQHGLPTILVEAAPRLGGRAGSFWDRSRKTWMDLGPHLLVGAYRETLGLWRTLGVDPALLPHPGRLRMALVFPGGVRTTLDCPALPPPWHLVAGLFRLQGLSWKERWALFRLHRLPRLDPRNRTAWDLLAALGQTRPPLYALWEAVLRAALNAPLEEAPGVWLQAVFREALLAGSHQGALIQPAIPLHLLWVEPAQRWLQDHGVTLYLAQPVEGLEVEGGWVRGIRLRGEGVQPVRAVVSTLPPERLARLLPPSLRKTHPLLATLDRWRPSPIVNLHLWFEEPVLDTPLLALVGASLPWVFQKDTHVVMVSSGDVRVARMDTRSLIQQALGDLRQSGFCPDRLREARCLRALRATYLPPSPEGAPLPGLLPGLNNLWVAGDWTQTGLPGTLESAARSAHQAVEALLQGL